MGDRLRAGIPSRYVSQPTIRQVGLASQDTAVQCKLKWRATQRRRRKKNSLYVFHSCRDTIRDAILACARKPTRVSFIDRTDLDDSASLLVA